ncbi:MAG: cytochrome c oxidase subunit 3 family protein [Candidatus Marinimicrobia bacterium]|jgi:cytochrome c oxidase subunit 3|nr:cytochrome c oxidase subunit 3 family protein [Candidatus Neomarinimicrobiota bacterium]MBT3630146.1 cytochrome c oxidase subunit 3 family protein [Candidatus Neomarinimicrobiota bacterium]MBT3826098.1 cytochrome c oxidase subunit 3 family protein [Candidatus Neomarinimicrobiota bacterium]MBT4132132.1 cytochrome c oxidase subunit 3 family protein [Candidatus Neomarinimicrobiota bacterium]MBT4296619.1 cytochrome c oxidase subunit 3 family protein [Candidatus Neomarinimicrobiota bacterium]
MSEPAVKVEAFHHHDEEGTRLGFWLFLFTELLLFGAFFIVYGVYRTAHLNDFKIAAESLNTGIGTTNTIILLASSLTMVLSLNAMKAGRVKLAKSMLLFTMALGTTFLVIKGFEWNAKFAHHLFLQTSAAIAEGKGSPLLTPGPDMLPDGQVLFYGLYFIMTGTHALHIIIGVVWMGIVYFWISKGSINPDNAGVLERCGLYWHLVDVIWIFLFPLYYLVA